MCIEEFISKYNFHDSLIDEVTFDVASKQVLMRVNFAYWKQEWYNEDTAETGPLTIIFKGVSQFVCPDDVPWEQISIIQASLENGIIKFSLMNDLTNEYLEVLVNCKSIDIYGHEEWWQCSVEKDGMKRFTCGTDMVCSIDGHCLSWKCPNCGDGIATSYFEPIEIDQTEYSIIMEKVEAPEMEQIKTTSQILNVNYLKARKLLIEGKAIYIGKAIPVQKNASLLKQNNLVFSIIPDFPYEIK